MKKNLHGFTLVEMLIVISIIAILSGAILAGMGSSRSKARNARVMSDVNTLQLIVENAYNVSSGGYPTDENALKALGGSDGSKVTAILNTGKVHYCHSGNSYRIQGQLEAGVDAVDLLKSSVSGAIGSCTCDITCDASKNSCYFCVGE